jgi:RTA1 like protein
MTVARLIYYILPDQQVFRIKATTLTKLFVWLDIVAFLVQAAGGVMLSSTNENPDILRPGQQTYMTGIGIQMAFIIIFSVFTGRLYIKMKRDGRPDRPVRKAKWLVWAMCIVFVLIVVRIFPLHRRTKYVVIGESNPASITDPHHLPPRRVCPRRRRRQPHHFKRELHLWA